MSDFIDQVVEVNISATSATPTLPGFKLLAIIGYHTHNTDRYRIYTDLEGMVSDGFATSEPLYRLAQSIVQQNPRPRRFMVIRATTAVAQEFTLESVDNTEGHSVGATIVAPDGTATECYYTVESGKSTTQVADSVATLIDNISGIAANNTGALITATGGTAGAQWYATDIVGFKFQDTTGDVSADDDLTAVALLDNSFYGLSGSWLSPINILNIAAWAESNAKLHAYTTGDSDNLAANDGVFDDLRDLSRDRSFGLFSHEPITYGATGWLAEQLVKTPGSSTFSFKRIRGTAVDTLNETEKTNILGSNGSFYITMATVPITFEGKCASGQFADITLGVDALTHHIQLRVATLLTTMEKVDYTRAGIELVAGAVRAGIDDSVRDGFISDEAGFQPLVSVPDLEDITPEDKAARVLNNVKFTATARSGIHRVTINGTVSV